MIMIYLMGVSDVFFAICSRGLSNYCIKFDKRNVEHTNRS
nr:MAG TPA: hypothetical protein [Caudoviricetes sp.]